MTAPNGRTVHFIEWNARIDTLTLGNVFPKYGTPLLATILRDLGYTVRIFLEGVSDMDPGRLADCDAVCMPVFAPIVNRVRACARRLRETRPAIPIILGGPHVCLYPETITDCCDIAVHGEGDEVLPEVLACLFSGGNLHGVRGISFRSDAGMVRTAERPPPAVPDTIPDLSLIEGIGRMGPVRPGRRRIVNALQTSRGCNSRCRFCPTATLFGGSFRTRSIDSVVEEIRRKCPANPFFFVVDNSFLGDRAHAEALLHRLAREKLPAHLIVFERHEVGFDTDMLRLMKRAGVRCLIVGVESLDDDNLRAYDKHQTGSRAAAAVESILENDIHVIGTFMFGGDSDTPAKADRVVEFVRDTGISLNLFIMHDVHHEADADLLIPLARRFETYHEEGSRFRDEFWDYRTGNFATYFPKSMPPSALQACVVDTYSRVYTHAGILRRTASRNLFASIFGVAHGYGIKRMNETVRHVVDHGYMEYLEQIEDGLYDGQGRLIEERLADLSSLPLPAPPVLPANRGRYNGMISLGVLPGLARYAARRFRNRLHPHPASAPAAG